MMKTKPATMTKTKPANETKTKPSTVRVAIGPGDKSLNGTDVQMEALIQNDSRPRVEDNEDIEEREPMKEKGSTFMPLPMAHRDYRVQQLPDSPLDLFQAFLPESLVEDWAKYTNESLPTDPQPRQWESRQHRWKPTIASELWIFIGILLYIQTNRRPRFEDYWKASAPDIDRSDHSIIKYMTYDRFCLIKRWFRLINADNIVLGVPHPFNKVHEWSDIQQDAATRLFVPGTNVAVDEGIVPFQGRVKYKVDMRNKPDGEGLKVWQLSQLGYLLRWIYQEDGPLGIEYRHSKTPIKDPTDIRHLNKTQAVVATLVDRLKAPGPVHVFVDNLFTGADLINVVRLMGHGLTGTVRPNAGIHEDIIKLKALDNKGQLDWEWGHHQSWPTANCLVRQTVPLINASITHI